MTDEVVFFFSGWEPVIRVVVVGTLAYIVLIFLLRMTAKRLLVQMNAFDLVITIAIGATFGRILTASSIALIEAVTAFVLLVVLQFAVSWARMRSSRFDQIVTDPPILLFFDGNFIFHALKKERVTEADLRGAVRKQGLGGFKEVEAIILEPNGDFAVVKKQSNGDHSALEELM